MIAILNRINNRTQVYKAVLENAGLESVIIKSVNLKKSKVGNQFVVCFNALENK